jgi:hypothetical protein
MWHLLLGCGEPGEIGLGEDRVADTVLARQIHVRKRRTDGGALRCEGVGVADELFEVALPPAEPRGESVRLDGLLADTTYRCEVVGMDQPSEVLEFTTDPLPDDLPRARVVEDGAPGGDYLVLNHGTDDKADRQTKILVYDGRGRLRFYHWVPFEAPDLDVQYLGGGHFLYGGGYRALPTVIDLSGEILRQAPGPFERGNYNHTVEQLPDGTVLTTETSPNRDPNDATNTWMGFSIELLDPSLQGRVFTLNSQTFVDRGELPVATTSSDPYHLNALQWLASEGQVVANLYRMSEVLWFDVSDRVLVDRFGVGTGWRLVDDDGTDLPSSEWFYGEHAIELDGDLMLMHDNGVGRPSPERYSRAVEYQLDPRRAHGHDHVGLDPTGLVREHLGRRGPAAGRAGQHHPRALREVHRRRGPAHRGDGRVPRRRGRRSGLAPPVRGSPTTRRTARRGSTGATCSTACRCVTDGTLPGREGRCPTIWRCGCPGRSCSGACRATSSWRSPASAGWSAGRPARWCWSRGRAARG